MAGAYEPRFRSGVAEARSVVLHSTLEPVPLQGSTMFLCLALLPKLAKLLVEIRICRAMVEGMRVSDQRVVP